MDRIQRIGNVNKIKEKNCQHIEALKYGNGINWVVIILIKFKAETKFDQMDKIFFNVRHLQNAVIFFAKVRSKFSQLQKKP